MHDRNDIKFKGSRGSPPTVKWQLLSWRWRTLSLPPTLSPSSARLFPSIDLAPQDIVCGRMGGEGVGPRGIRDQMGILRRPMAPTAARSPPAPFPLVNKRGNNPAPLPLGSNHTPIKAAIFTSRCGIFWVFSVYRWTLRHHSTSAGSTTLR